MILLDTHAYYWFITGDDRLPENVKSRIEEEEAVFVSIVSFWEMAIKSSIGKLKLPAPIKNLVEDCAEYEITVLPINGLHLSRLEKLPFIHRDPFDRLLICQALEENLTLITVDENIQKYDVRTLWS